MIFSPWSENHSLEQCKGVSTYSRLAIDRCRLNRPLCLDNIDSLRRSTMFAWIHLNRHVPDLPIYFLPGPWCDYTNSRTVSSLRDATSPTFFSSTEFWEDHFRCKYPNSSRTPYNSHYSTECTTHEKLSRDTLAFEKQLQFVSDAVMAFSIALDHMHADLCQGKVGLCDAMRPTKGPELLKYLRKVSFQGE
jgi:Receptor family ligand binding region.